MSSLEVAEFGLWKNGLTNFLGSPKSNRDRKTALVFSTGLQRIISNLQADSFIAVGYICPTHRYSGFRKQDITFNAKGLPYIF